LQLQADSSMKVAALVALAMSGLAMSGLAMSGLAMAVNAPQKDNRNLKYVHNLPLAKSF
ncbi:hypothetical protein EsDP_00004752, partial [Epichloe bromicola]